MDKEELAQKLFTYFGFNYIDGTYIYNLTRSKSAFNVGTMTLDDFEEIDEEFIYELADYILELFQDKEIIEKIYQAYEEIYSQEEKDIERCINTLKLTNEDKEKIRNKYKDLK